MKEYNWRPTVGICVRGIGAATTAAAASIDRNAAKIRMLTISWAVASARARARPEAGPQTMSMVSDKMLATGVVAPPLAEALQQLEAGNVQVAAGKGGPSGHRRWALNATTDLALVPGLRCTATTGFLAYMTCCCDGKE